jgi:hypothetical protein
LRHFYKTLEIPTTLAGDQDFNETDSFEDASSLSLFFEEFFLPALMVAPDGFNCCAGTKLSGLRQCRYFSGWAPGLRRLCACAFLIEEQFAFGHGQ